MDNEIKSELDLLTFIQGNKKIKAKIQKQDGTSRIMKATLDFDLIPEKSKPKKIDMKKIMSHLKNGIVHVFDLDKKEWRTLKYKNIEWLESESDIRYSIKK